MNNNSDIDWVSMSDNALNGVIGDFVKYHRLNQNKTQTEVSKAAGISRSTMSLLEKGEKILLGSLIKVLRVLDLLYIMNVFMFDNEISPIEYAKLQKKNKKYRARPKGTEKGIEDLGW